MKKIYQNVYVLASPGASIAYTRHGCGVLLSIAGSDLPTIYPQDTVS